MVETRRSRLSTRSRIDDGGSTNSVISHEPEQTLQNRTPIENKTQRREEFSRRSKTVIGSKYKRWLNENSLPSDHIPKVFCKIKIYRVSNFDIRNMQVEIDFVLMMDWVDESILYYPECDLDLEHEHFSPYVQIHNAVGENVKPIDEAMAVNRVQKNPTVPGHVKRTERYRTKVFTDLKLEKYPFDKHELIINLKGDHIELRSESTKLEGEINPRDKGGHDFTEMQNSAIMGWEVVGQKEDLRGHGTGHLLRSELRLALTVKRNPHGIVMLLVLPLFICIILSLTSFMLDEKALADRLTITVTMLLAVAAFHQQAQSHVPPNLPYTTVLDNYMLSNVFLFLVQGLIHIVICKWRDSDTDSNPTDVQQSISNFTTLKLLNSTDNNTTNSSVSAMSANFSESETSGTTGTSPLSLSYFLSCLLLFVMAWIFVRKVR